MSLIIIYVLLALAVVLLLWTIVPPFLEQARTVLDQFPER